MEASEVEELESRIKLELLGTSDDTVLIREIRQRASRVPEVEKVEKDDEEVFKIEETDEVITDEDGEVITKEKVVDTNFFMALRGAELNVEDTLKVEFEYDSHEEVWTASVKPYVKVYEVAGEKEKVDVAELPEDWSVDLKNYPEEVGGTAYGLCVEITMPEDDYTQEIDIEQF